eukprot:5633895-Amphidinium_carterae.1
MQRSLTYAIVGESGSGKSTIMALIMKFYEPTGGSFMINNKSSSLLSAVALRKIFGYVPQEPVLFSVSIQANIAMGLGGKATQNNVKQACELTKVNDFADKLPEKLETICSASHSNLSGGQRQRVALARALLVQPQ